MNRQAMESDRRRVRDMRIALAALLGPSMAANLVLGLGFGTPAICVDTHVHRICNRLGWVRTRTPDDTELALARSLPRQYWIPINGIMVGYGQQVCTPVAPHCSRCPLRDTCPRHGVTRHR